MQDCLAALEGGKYGLAFASGLAATDTVLRLLNADDHILAGNDVYGGTFRLFDKVLRRFKLDFTFADTTDQVCSGARAPPAARLAGDSDQSFPAHHRYSRGHEIIHAHENKPLLVVDNTFATPYLQRPLDLARTLSYTR